MSIKAGVNAFLKATGAITAIVSTRITHRELPQNPTYPCLVYSQVSDIAIEHTHDQRIGPRRAVFQLDGYAETVTAAENLMEALYAALVGYRGAMGAYTVGGVFDAGENPDMSFRSETTLKWIEGRSRDFELIYYG